MVRINSRQLLLIFTASLFACAGNPVTPPTSTGGAGDETASNSQLAPVGPLDLPHPVGLDYADLREIFFYPGAPKIAELNHCDKDINQLASLTSAKNEFQKGVRELVHADPQAYHWCFYGKLLGLVQDLRGDDYIDQKQKRTVETFQILVPVARALMEEVQDSRYLRWTVRSYQRLSEWVFYRRLELSPLGTSEMIGLGPDYVTERRENLSDESVIERYGIKPAPAREPAQSETQPAFEPPSPSTPQEVPVPSEATPADPSPTVE